MSAQSTHFIMLFIMTGKVLNDYVIAKQDKNLLWQFLIKTHFRIIKNSCVI